MRYNFSEDEIKEIKTQFRAWQEIQGEKKELSAAEADTKEKVAEIIEGKKGDVGKLFKAMQQIEDGLDNDLDEVGAVLEAVRSNGSSGDEEAEEEAEE